MTPRTRTLYSVAWLILAALTLAALVRTPDTLNTLAAVLCAWVGGLITWPLVGDLRLIRAKRTANR